MSWITSITLPISSAAVAQVADLRVARIDELSGVGGGRRGPLGTLGHLADAGGHLLDGRRDRLDVGRHLLGRGRHVGHVGRHLFGGRGDLADWLVVSSAPLASCVAVADSSVADEATVLTFPAICPIMPCSFSTNWLKYRAMSPISSWLSTASRLVRSPSPSEMSLSMSAARRIGMPWKGSRASGQVPFQGVALPPLQPPSELGAPLPFNPFNPST